MPTYPTYPSGALPLLVVNPRAAWLKRKQTRLEQLRRMVRGRADIAVTQDVTELAQVAESLVKRWVGEPRAPIFLVGGDGTHMSGVTAFHQAFGGRPPPFALIAGGTVCTTARVWGSSGRADTDIRRALRSHERAPMPTLCIEDDTAEHLGFIFGTGLVARFFEVYDDRGGGLPVAAKLSAEIFTSALRGSALAQHVLGRMPLTLSIDGVEQSERGYSLVVSCVHETVGMGVRVTYRARHDRERFHLVASAETPTGLARNFPRTFLGLPLSGRGNVDALANEAVIRFEGPTTYIIDGDSRVTNQVRLRTGPVLSRVVF
jgi:diacylglycerol kinase (ATP)